ncbi:MAG: relaxase/mobilization nuclease domain-containing protein [Xenococcus sp. MO_188.B8]|nr:relaxase/mobilization nuclease domain-containing protein [Xenococcus sp. MO_188.B8]
MIGKITTGSNFKSLFNYLLKKGKEAKILGGDFVLLEPNIKRLTTQFDWVAKTRLTTKKPVKHLSISFAPEDGQVSSKTKVAISKKVVNELGYTNNQWLVIAHGRDDPGHDWQHEHDHIHIVVNGINLDGERVNDSFDKTRLENILRNLEQEHGLKKVISSTQCNRHRPSTKQLRRYQRETKEYKQKKQDTPPEIPIMAKLEAAISAASSDKPTMTLFIGRLQHLGIDVRPYITDKGRKRISYSLEDLKVRGSKIHNGSFPKLISQRGIDFNETRDTPALEAAFQGKTVTVKDEQLLTWSRINQSSQKNNLISASDRGNPIWHQHNLLGSENNHFWFKTNDNGNPIKKIVVTSSPVEAVSAHLVNDVISGSDCPCLYVSFDSPEPLNELDLTSFDTIVISSNDRQIFPDNIPNLVVEKDVSSWQQSWLIRWHEIQKIMELEARAAASARKKNSLSKKTSKKERQLEL